MVTATKTPVLNTVTAEDDDSTAKPRRQAKRRLTARDQLFLEWLVQQYAAPIDLVAKWYGVRRSWAYEIVKCLRDNGVVTCTYASGRASHIPGPMWVVPTRGTAHAILGTDPGPWTVRPSTAEHLHALGALRLGLVGRSTDHQRWFSERLLARALAPIGKGTEIEHSRPYTHDAVMRDVKGKCWAIECELTAKTGDGRMQAVLRTSVATAINTLPRLNDLGADSVAGVIYFCGNSAVRRHVEKAKSALDDDIARYVHVRDLDAYMGGFKKQVLS